MHVPGAELPAPDSRLELAPETLEKLGKVLGVGSLISNPIDGGFGVLQSEATYKACIEAMQEDPNVDMVLLQEA